MGPSRLYEVRTLPNYELELHKANIPFPQNVRANVIRPNIQ